MTGRTAAPGGRRARQERQEAQERLVAEAAALGAGAVLAISLDACEIGER